MNMKRCSSSLIPRFSLFLLATCLSAFFAHAYPESAGDVSMGSGSGSGSSNEIVLYINNDPLPTPLLPYLGYCIGAGDGLKDITSARLENAPPGYGCFFASPENPFVSQTFFSTSTSYYRSPLFQPFALESEFKNAGPVICFRLPNPATYNRSMYVMLDLTDARGERALQFKEVKLRNLLAVRIGGLQLDSGLTVNRAAIVHATSQRTECRVQRRNALRFTKFSKNEPLLQPFENAHQLVCYT